MPLPGQYVKEQVQVLCVFYPLLVALFETMHS